MNCDETHDKNDENQDGTRDENYGMIDSMVLVIELQLGRYGEG